MPRFFPWLRVVRAREMEDNNKVMSKGVFKTKVVGRCGKWNVVMKKFLKQFDITPNAEDILGHKVVILGLKRRWVSLY